MKTNQLTLFHSPEDRNGKKIRSELNLEKWSIWLPSQSRVDRSEIVRERETLRSDGSKELARVTIQRVGKSGLFTTEDQKTYYALIKLWEEKGKPDGPTAVSIRQLAQILKKGWGSKVLKSLTESLLRLRTVPFIWENSYYNATTRETEEHLSAFTILEDLKLHRTRKDGHVNKEQGSFRFNGHILKNLQANHTKPLYLDVILTFQSDIAQLLYTYLDLIMADKTCYERRSAGLFADLGLEGKAYRNVSDRKRKLARALQELQGVQLSTGTLVEAALTQTVDDKDVKAVFRKQGFAAAKPALMLTDGSPNTSPASDVSAEAAAALVQYFHKRLDRPAKRPSAKERGQAAQLLAQHGDAVCRYIVDYAIVKAQTTQFDMQTFGALAQYADLAVREYDQKHGEHAAQRPMDDQHQLSVDIPCDEAQRVAREQAFEALDAATRDRLLTRVEASLVNRKAQMTPTAYQATVAILMKQAFWEEFYAAEHTIPAL